MSEPLWFDPSSIPTPALTFGEQTAWTLTESGKTAGLSAIHRVREEGTALCGEWMPAPMRHVPPLGLNRPVCERCENIYASVTVGV